MDDDTILLMRRFKAQLLAREARQMQLMSARWMALEARLGDQILLLAQDMADRRANGLPIGQGALVRLERYQQLLAQIQAEWQQYQTFAAQAIVEGQRQLGALGIQHAAGVLDGVAGTFARLPATAVEALVGLLADGSPLTTLLADRAVTAGMLDGLTGALLEGTALGWQPRKTARRMKNGLVGGLNKALTIARDTQLRVYREMNRQQMAASGVVEGYFRLVTRDTRTCPACLARDGEFIPLGETMAEHTQGRCGQVPKVIGLAAPTWTKGPDWFRTLSPGEQSQILGPARYDAWREGAFDFAELATVKPDSVWGDSLQVTPLAQLASPAGG